jgi:DNA-binding protein H-NS
VQPKKSTLTTLSNESLFQLRDEIGALLKSRAEDLQRELNRLTGGLVAHEGSAKGERKSKKPTKKVAPKYRGPNGETWSGRGLKPRWLTAEINSGKQLEDFLIAAGGSGRDSARRGIRRQSKSVTERAAVATHL